MSAKVKEKNQNIAILDQKDTIIMLHDHISGCVQPNSLVDSNDNSKRNQSITAFEGGLVPLSIGVQPNIS